MPPLPNNTIIPGLSKPLSGAKRRAKPTNLEVVKVLSKEDLAELELPTDYSAPAVKKMRDRHHSIARMIALGIPNTQIGAVLNISSNRISTLISNPAFAELVSFYRAEAGTEFRDMIARFTDLGLEISGELLSRIDASPESFSAGELRELLKVVADRAGFSPVQKKMEISGRIPDEVMARVKTAAEAREEIREIGSQGEGGSLSRASGFGSVAKQKAARSSGEGDAV